MYIKYSSRSALAPEIEGNLSLSQVIFIIHLLFDIMIIMYTS